MGQNNSGKNVEETQDDLVVSGNKFTISSEPLVGSDEVTTTASTPASTGGVSLAEAFQTPAFEDLGPLPETYHEDVLYLVARDPHWLFAYWDVNWTVAGSAKYYLKIFVSGKIEVATVEIKPEARNWYVEVGNASTTYFAELGFFDEYGIWVSLATSGEATTPSSGISQEEAADFATVPFHLTLQRLIEMLKEQMEEGESLVEALARLQGGSKFAFVRGQIPTWTDEQKRILAALFGSEMVDLAGMGSAEIDQFLRKQPCSSFPRKARVASPARPVSPVCSVAAASLAVCSRVGSAAAVGAAASVRAGARSLSVSSASAASTCT
ncbi:MAG: DUF4912 domain-containing protein [Chthoniobacteraceae bacterium]